MTTLASRVRNLLDRSGGPIRLLRPVMIDPFRFNQERCGLCWGQGRLTLVIAGRGRKGMQALDTVTLSMPHAGDESLTHALQALRRQRPGYLPPVILGLDSAMLGYRLLTPPDPLPADLPAWVVAQAPHVVPPGIWLAEIALDFRVAQHEEKSCLQVVWAKRDRIRQVIEKINQAGLQVTGVYPQVLAVAEGIRAPSDTPLVFCDAAAVTFIPLTDGLPQHLHEVAWDDPDTETDWNALVECIRELLPAHSSRVTLAADESPDAPASGVAMQSALKRQDIQVKTITGLDSASALAHAGLDPTRDIFKLLPDPDVDPAQQEQDRRWALRVGWGGGAVVTLILVMALLFGLYYGWQQRRLTRELTSKSDWIAEVRGLVDTEQALSREVAALQTMRKGRTGMAGLLEDAGRSVPDKLWLRSFRITRQKDDGKYQVDITGLARTEAALGSFLSNLESGGAWQSNGSFTTSRIDPATVRKQTGVNVSLIRFEVSLMATNK